MVYLSRPKELGRFYNDGNEDDVGIQNGYDRALLNWYSIDPIFIADKDHQIFRMMIPQIIFRRIFINEIFQKEI